VVGGAKVDPGGPDIYVAVIGKAKSLLRARTAIICPRCRIPANTFVFRRLCAVIVFVIAKEYLHPLESAQLRAILNLH